MKKTVIIGGVAGGATAAARLRRNEEEREIVILEKGDYISFANCGLPYYIGDVIKRRESLLLQTKEGMKKKFNIDVKTNSEAIQIVPDDKKVVVRNTKTGEEWEEEYDELVLATGSSPIKPPLEGIDLPTIFTLWNIPDTDQIKAYLEEHSPKRAAIIGGGFIGLEMAENLHAKGIEVTIIEMQNQVMAPLDYEMAQLLHENMRSNGVHLMLSHAVERFSKDGTSTKIHLSGGKELETDLVILSIGVRPNSQLAKEAGLALNQRGGILVDEEMHTSLPYIYAIGDVVEVTNLASKEKAMIPLAGPANKQGRICADNITGAHKKYRGSFGTAVAKVFDLNAASVGLNEKALENSGKVKGKDYFVALINQKSHAGYYPGALTLTLKLLFEQDGTIVGAQVVGQEGVDKRIDVLASTMRLGGTIYELEELELAYAPPFSSAKDPVNMLGFVAENILEGKVRFIEWQELDTLLSTQDKGITVLDVTEEMERLVYQIPESYSIPLGSLRERMGELNKEKEIIVYCAVGIRSYNAARILQQNGFSKVRVLAGGTQFYKSMHHSVLVPTVEIRKEETKMPEQEIKVLDCSGLQCPGPIMKVYQAINEMQPEEILKVSATDMGFAKDIDAWCKRTGNTLVKTERIQKEHIVYIKKGMGECPMKQLSAAQSPGVGLPQGKTIIVFSGDLDKVLASFIIANGAAAMGRPVTMFFTFWGLNALRKTEKVAVKKSFIESMFGVMMPRGTKKLTLSQMNMAGMGTKMMKMVMKHKNVDTLEYLMKQAMENGVKLVACTMSMDVMGITKEELIEGVELAGVGAYLADAEEANVNLFIS